MAKTKTQDSPATSPEAFAATAVQERAADAPMMEAGSLQSFTEKVMRPGLTPPGELVAAEDAGITAWHNGKKITAMWCNASNRNAFAAVEGLGWKRLSNANDSAFLSLVMLASHAEQTNSTVNVEVGTDQEIHQIYVW